MAINSITASLPAAIPAKPAAPSYSAKSSETVSETSETTSEASPPSRQQVNQAMEKMQESLPFVARNLQFSVDEETGRSVVKIVDSVTHEVVRQMPSEELLNIAKALDKMTGLLLKQKA